MICVNCTKLAQKLNSVMIEKEIISILTGQIILLRSVESKANAEDRSIINSIITKCLLALPIEKRAPLMEYMIRVSGIKITLDKCTHASGLMLV